MPTPTLPRPVSLASPLSKHSLPVSERASSATLRASLNSNKANNKEDCSEAGRHSDRILSHRTNQRRVVIVRSSFTLSSILSLPRALQCLGTRSRLSNPRRVAAYSVIRAAEACSVITNSNRPISNNHPRKRTRLGYSAKNLRHPQRVEVFLVAVLVKTRQIPMLLPNNRLPPFLALLSVNQLLNHQDLAVVFSVRSHSLNLNKRLNLWAVHSLVTLSMRPL